MSHHANTTGAGPAISSGVDAIGAALGPRGQWPGTVVPDAAPHASRRDMAAPLTALGVLCLRGTPGSDAVVAASLEHIQATVLAGGVWRYYANIPWDTDDTAMCALALGPEHPTVAETIRTLRGLTLVEGLFPTWVEPGWVPCVDAVVNAHIVALLGEGPKTAEAIAWLNWVIDNALERQHCAFYPDPLDTHMAITRAVNAGVVGLVPALTTAADRVLHRLADGGLSAYRTAQAVVVAATADKFDPARLQATADRLMHLQEDNGMWPAESLFTVASTEDYGGAVHYTSAAVVTALCVRALACLAGDPAGDPPW